MPKLVAEIVIENSSPTFDKAYTYIVPDSMQNTALPGARVRVPFGRANKTRTGLIIKTSIFDDPAKLKEIESVIDNPPILSKEAVGILHYLKQHTFCSWFDALRLLIPSGLDIKTKYSYRIGKATTDAQWTGKLEDIISYLSKRKKGVQDYTLYKNIEILPDDKDLAYLVEKGYVVKTSEITNKILDDKIIMISLVDDSYQNLTPKQTEAMDFIRSESPVSLRETLYYTGLSRSVIDTLEKRGVIEYYEKINSRGEYAQAQNQQPDDIILSDEQDVVYNKLAANLGSYNTSLLYGITGSGKTRVFLKLVADVFAQGKGAIVMVPEIMLTSQTVKLLQNQFGNNVAVLHSGLSLGERADEWKRIKDGKARVVVGTRSAVFAPVENLGLIVIDEEHEHTYKSDRSPRFHAREIAQMRMKYHNGMVLLCSATPSVESYYSAKSGRYNFYELKNRYGGSLLPEVRVVDMNEPSNLSVSLGLSQPLLDELYYNLQKGEQSILLLNRRGYSTVVKCTECAEVAECKNCSVALTYHAVNDSLICHYCGYRKKLDDPCDNCESTLSKLSGIGTQKLESELKTLFADAKILRMDMDTTMTKDSHRDMIEAFQNKEYDILIGTQMVAKGLNFPDVTLVGILNADQSLYSDDFRSYERSFALFTQVMGRSGRGRSLGRAIVQTYSPDHPIIELASHQDYPDFYSDEIISRKLHLYPPFCTIAGFGFVGEKHEITREMAYKFAEYTKKLVKEEYPDLPLRILGPSPSDMLKIANKYRYKMIVKCRNDSKTRELFERITKWFYENSKDVIIYIDMYYDKM